jgi:hypothetical protein
MEELKVTILCICLLTKFILEETRGSGQTKRGRGSIKSTFKLNFVGFQKPNLLKHFCAGIST